MPVCTGGTQPKTGSPSTIALIGEGIAALISLRFPWLGMVAGFASPFVMDVASLCSSDPPAVPTWTATDILALLSPIQSAAKLTASEKLRDTIHNVAWYQFCECTVGGAQTPPAPTAPPADLPVINPQPPDLVDGGSGYVAEVIADAPSFYWRFAELGGRVAHSIGPAPRWPFMGVAAQSDSLGYSGPAHDGGSLQLREGAWLCPFTTQWGTPGFTVEFWAWTPADYWPASSVWLSLGPGGNRAMDIGTFNEAHTIMYSGGITWQFGDHISGPRWQHLVAVHTATQILQYTDGVLTATRTHTPVSTLYGPFSLISSTNGFFLSELALYDTELSAGRILAHYEAADSRAFRPVHRGSKLAQLQAPAASAWDAQPLLELLTLIQRQEVPFGYVDGTAHAGLTGDGSFAVSGIIGLRVDLTTIPAYVGYMDGTPTTYWDVGSIALGDATGYRRREQLRHASQLIFDDDAGVYSLVGYSLPPNVVATVTELVREP